MKSSIASLNLGSFCASSKFIAILSNLFFPIHNLNGYGYINFIMAIPHVKTKAEIK